MAVERRASVSWSGTIASGTGSIAVGSGAFPTQPIALQTRIAEPAGHTSPEELIAAAHAACYTMSIASVLTERGIAATGIAVDATCVEGPVADGFAITNVNLDVTIAAPGLTLDALQDVIDIADRGCPVARALRGNVDIRITARLAP